MNCSVHVPSSVPATKDWPIHTMSIDLQFLVHRLTIGAVYVITSFWISNGWLLAFRFDLGILRGGGSVIREIGLHVQQDLHPTSE